MLLLPSHGIKFSSPYACMSPNDIKGPGLGFPYQGLIMSQLLFPRLCSTLRLACGKHATSKCCKCSEPKGTVSESYCSVSGSHSWGFVGSCKTRVRSESSRDTKFGKYFGNPDTMGYQTPVLWLGKGAKGSIYNGDMFF